MVKSFGFATQAVSTSEENHRYEACFAYTIGMGSLGLPDIILSGNFNARTAANLLGETSVFMCNNTRGYLGKTDEIANTPTLLLPCESMKIITEDYAVLAERYYEVFDHPRNPLQYLQLVWPSADGLFPCEIGYPKKGNEQTIFCPNNLKETVRLIRN